MAPQHLVFIKVSHRKTFFLYSFRIFKQNWKISIKKIFKKFLSRVIALWKKHADFQFIRKKWKFIQNQQNHKNLGTNWCIFWNVFMMHYHCIKFLVSSISLSRDMGHGEKWPPLPWPTRTRKCLDLIVLKQFFINFVLFLFFISLKMAAIYT